MIESSSSHTPSLPVPFGSRVYYCYIIVPIPRPVASCVCITARVGLDETYIDPRFTILHYSLRSPSTSFGTTPAPPSTSQVIL